MKKPNIKRFMFLKKHVTFINVPTYNNSFNQDYELLIIIVILIFASIA